MQACIKSVLDLQLVLIKHAVNCDMTLQQKSLIYMFFHCRENLSECIYFNYVNISMSKVHLNKAIKIEQSDSDKAPA